MRSLRERLVARRGLEFVSAGFPAGERTGVADFSSLNQPIIDEFRAHGGLVESRGFGRSLVLVHHVGAKTGAARVAPVMAIHPDGDTWWIAASKAGAPEHPAWYHNLLAHPETVIEVPDEGEVAVRAEELAGAERDAAWVRFVERSPAFGEYEQRTARTIPVVALRRR